MSYDVRAFVETFRAEPVDEYDPDVVAYWDSVENDPQEPDADLEFGPLVVADAGSRSLTVETGEFL